MVDLNDPLVIVDLVEDAVAAGPQAAEIRRPVGERLRRARLIGQSADEVPEGGDAGGIVAEEARCQIDGPDLLVDLVAHRVGRPSRRPASSWET